MASSEPKTELNAEAAVQYLVVKPTDGGESFLMPIYNSANGEVVVSSEADGTPVQVIQAPEHVFEMSDQVVVDFPEQVVESVAIEEPAPKKPAKRGRKPKAQSTATPSQTTTRKHRIKYMTPFCASSLCTTNKAPFFPLPTDPDLREKWIEAANREPFDNMKFCALHFTDDDYERDLKHELLGVKRKLKLKETAVPSQNLMPTKEQYLTVARSIGGKLRIDKLHVDPFIDDAEFMAKVDKVRPDEYLQDESQLVLEKSVRPRGKSKSTADPELIFERPPVSNDPDRLESLPLYCLQRRVINLRQELEELQKLDPDEIIASKRTMKTLADVNVERIPGIDKILDAPDVPKVPSKPVNIQKILAEIKRSVGMKFSEGKVPLHTEEKLKPRKIKKPENDKKRAAEELSSRLKDRDIIVSIVNPGNYDMSNVAKSAVDQMLEPKNHVIIKNGSELVTDVLRKYMDPSSSDYEKLAAQSIVLLGQKSFGYLRDHLAADLKVVSQMTTKRSVLRRPEFADKERTYQRLIRTRDKLKEQYRELKKSQLYLTSKDQCLKKKKARVREKWARRKKWLLEQIKAGRMDKSALVLVRSRKILPFEVEEKRKKRKTKTKTAIKTKIAEQVAGSDSQQIIITEVPYSEVIVQHEGDREEGETSFYETVNVNVTIPENFSGRQDEIEAAVASIEYADTGPTPIKREPKDSRVQAKRTRSKK